MELLSLSLYQTKNESDCLLIATLWCNVFRIWEMRNLGEWLCQSLNEQHRGHATCNQHAASMTHQQATSVKMQGKPVESYAPIACSLLVMDDRE